jgi:hypothetical protein
MIQGEPRDGAAGELANGVARALLGFVEAVAKVRRSSRRRRPLPYQLRVQLLNAMSPDVSRASWRRL